MSSIALPEMDLVETWKWNGFIFAFGDMSLALQADLSKTLYSLLNHLS